MDLKLSCVGLSTQQQHLVRLAVGLMPRGEDRIQVVEPTASRIDILLVNAANVAAIGQVAELRRRNPGSIDICVSDSGVLGRSQYRLESRRLVQGLVPMLRDVITTELRRGAAVISAPVQAAAPQLAPYGLKHLQALIVDDSQVVRDQLATVLREIGVRVAATASAEEALQHLPRVRPNVLLLDVVLPGISGYELCRRIKQDPSTRECFVLMLTSKTSPFDRARAAMAGCDSYLTKPVARQQLLDAIARSTAHRQANPLPSPA